MTSANMVRGDRTRPRLPVEPRLRAVGRKVKSAAAGCPLFSRIDGRLVRDGSVAIKTALRLLVAGEG